MTTLYKNPDGHRTRMKAPTQEQFEDCCCAKCYDLTPCYETGTACSYYTALGYGTPKYWTIYFDDLGYDPSCYAPGTIGYKVSAAFPFSLRVDQQGGDSCFWYGSDEGSGSTHVDTYYDTACVNWWADATGTGIIARLHRYPSGTHLEIVVGAWGGGFVMGSVLHEEAVYIPQEITFPASDPSWPGIGSVHVVPGDVENAAIRCPGGVVIRASNDLSAYVGKVILLTEDGQDVCYQVAEAPSCDGAAILDLEVLGFDPETDVYDDCATCCAA